jgi:hypothetical protein
MTREDLVESVKMQLGYPVITLYTKDEQINSMIGTAIRKCQSKACPTFSMSAVITDGKLSLAGMNLETVKNVYSDVGTALYPADIFSNNLYIQSNLMEAVWAAGKRSEQEKLALSDFYMDKEFLYVDNFSGLVTIEYVKKDIEFDELDIEWRGWVESYVTALIKIIEGRIRGKYKLQSGPFEVEADQLISEGTSALSELDSKLDVSMGYFNILR